MAFHSRPRHKLYCVCAWLLLLHARFRFRPKWLPHLGTSKRASRYIVGQQHMHYTTVDTLFLPINLFFMLQEQRAAQPVSVLHLQA